MGVNIDLCDFDNDEIEEYAKNHLDMVKRDDIDLKEDFSIYEIEEYLLSEGYNMDSQFFYPNNSITTHSTYRTLLNNVNKIPLSEIENLITKYNCI